MSKASGVPLLLVMFARILFAQAIAGIHVGDSPSALEKVGSKPLARATLGVMESVKYKTADGNDVSFTYDGTAKRIVYIECDWAREPKGAQTDFPGLKFGVTTLEEIQKRNGSNGFTYQSRGIWDADGELVAFNAYELKDKPGLVVVFATSFNIAELQKRRANLEPGAEGVANNLKLIALILAEQSYLDQMWGREKIYDKGAAPISWGPGR